MHPPVLSAPGDCTCKTVLAFVLRGLSWEPLFMGEEITSAIKDLDTHYLPGCNVYLSCLAHPVFHLWPSLSPLVQSLPHAGSILLSSDLLATPLDFLPSLGPNYSSRFLHLQL